jgi:hypothetical protein
MSFWIIGLTDLPIGISARSVEVAKRDRSQAARRVEIGEHAFDDQFGIPVRITGRASRGAYLCGEYARRTVGAFNPCNIG